MYNGLYKFSWLLLAIILCGCGGQDQSAYDNSSVEENIIDLGQVENEVDLSVNPEKTNPKTVKDKEEKAYLPALAPNVIPPVSPSVTNYLGAPPNIFKWSWPSNGGGNGTYRYQLDGEEDQWIETTNTTYSVKGNGVKTLYVQERDKSGNWSASSSYKVFIPIITITDLFGNNIEQGAITNQQKFNITIDTVVEPSWWSKHDVGVENGILQNWQGSGQHYTGEIVANGQGSVTVTIAAEKYSDGANWRQQNSASSFSWHYDAPPSSPNIIADLNTANTFTWNWSPNVGGNGTYRYQLDDEDDNGWTETTKSTYSVKGNGVKTLYVQERDKSGNWSASASYRVFLPIIPIITITDLSGNNIEQGAITNQQKFNITIDTVVEPSWWSKHDVGVENGILQNWQGSGQHYTGEIVANGQGSVTVTIAAEKYSDGANWRQQNSASSFSWHYDAPPSSPNIIADLNTANTFTWNWSPNVGGNGTYRYQLDDEDDNGWTETTKSTYSVKGNGVKTLYVQERDKSGNWSASASYRVFLPIIPIITITDLSGNNIEQGAITNQQKFNITIDTVVEPSWWSKHDVGVENGILQNWQGSGQHYTGEIVANGQGSVTVTIAAEKYSDGANWRQQNSASSFSWHYDAPPSSPNIIADLNTANTFTWNWSPNGGGNGTYRYQLDGEEDQWIETTNTTYSVKGNGVKTLYVQERDKSGNWAASASYKVFLPIITITDLSGNNIEQGAITNQQKFNITIDTVVEPLWWSKYNVGVENGILQNWQGSGQHYTGEIVANGQGSVTVTIAAEEYSDGANWRQQNSASSFSWHYDAPPSSPNIIADLNTANTFTWNWSPNGGGNGTYRYQLDGEEDQWIETTNTTYSVKGNGVKTLYVQERDKSGNWAASASYKVFLPIITITDLSGNNIEQGAITNQQKFNITIDTVVEPLWWSKYNVGVENGILQNWQGSGQHYTGEIVANGQGSVTVTIAAEEYSDGANWRQQNSASSFSWHYDAPPSSPNIIADLNTANTFTWNWSPNGGGNGTYRYQLDGEEDQWIETTNTTYSVKGNGVKTLYVQERDKSGNWSASASYKVFIPIITITDLSANNIEQGAITNQQKFNITIDTVVEPSWWSKYNVGVENGILQNWQGSGQHYTGEIVANGQGSVTVTIAAEEYSDGANWRQQNSASSFSWNIDSDKPFKPIISGFQGPTNSPKWSWSSGGYGDGLFRYRLSNNPDWTEARENYFAPNDLEVGEYTLELQEKDNAGNWSYSSYYTIHVAEYNKLLEAASKFIELRLMPIDGKSSYQGNLSTTNLFKGNLTYSIAKQPLYGEVNINDPSTGNFTYRLTDNSFSPTDSDYFEFKVVDIETNQNSSARINIIFKSDPLYKYQWHLDNTGQTNFADNGGTVGEDLNVDSVISDGHTGKNITVGVVDDGLDINHEDLKDKVALGSWDFVDGDSDPSWDNEKGQREGNHGTAVGGIIGAVGWNNIGVRGIAPDVSLKGFRLIGNSSTENEIDALGGSSKANSSDIDIFNMSYGSSNVFLSTMDEDLEEHLWMSLSESDDCHGNNCQGLRQGKGAVFVKAAGNGFNRIRFLFISISCPLAKEHNLSCELTFMDGTSNHPGIINVAAFDANGKATTYSTQGAANWISAPAGEKGINSDNLRSFSMDGQPATMTTDTSSCGAGYDSEYANNEFNSTKPVHIENQDCNYTSTFNGTSAATPMVSGVAALILGANPQLTWRDVKYILAKTARKIDANNEVRGKVVVNNVEVETGWIENSAGFNFHNAYGFGAVNAASAVQLALQFKDSPRQVGDFKKYPELESGDIKHTLKPKTQFTQIINSEYEGIIEAVRIDVGIAYDYLSDLSIALVSPSGTRSVLVSPFNGMRQVGFFSGIFDDSEEQKRSPSWLRLSSNAFYGENMKGDWMIEIFDHLDEENNEDQEKRDWIKQDPDGENALIFEWKLKLYGHE